MHYFRRRASAYLFFLGTSMAVTVIGLSALMVVRIQRRSAEGLNDFAAARFLAQSAIEHGFTLINDNASWRSINGSGLWVADQTTYGGTYSLDALFIDDGDGNIANDDVVLTGTGTSGDVSYRIEVTLIAQGTEVSIGPGSWKRKVN